jgi:hypothetical protein
MRLDVPGHARLPHLLFLASTISARSDRTIAIIRVLHLRQQADLRCETR